MPDPVDPERPREGNAFDTDEGTFGQGYTVDRERAEGRRSRGGTEARPGSDRSDTPPDNGRRASFNQATGEVHGSGVGAGGGQPGEDFDSDAQNGDGYPLTGGEGASKQPGDLGPAHIKE